MIAPSSSPPEAGKDTVCAHPSSPPSSRSVGLSDYMSVPELNAAPPPSLPPLLLILKQPTKRACGRPLKGRLPMRCAVPFLFTPPIDMQHARGVCTLLWQRLAHLVGLHAPLRSHWAPPSPPALCFLRRASDAVSLPSFLCSCLTSDNSITPFILARSLRWRRSALAREVPGPSHASRGMQGGACLFVEGDGNAWQRIPVSKWLEAGVDRAGPCHGEEATCEVDLARGSEAELAFTVINFASLLTLLPSPLFLPLPVLNRRHLSHRPPSLSCSAPPFRSPLFFLSFPEWRISRIGRAAPARNATTAAGHTKFASSSPF